MEKQMRYLLLKMMVHSKVVSAQGKPNAGEEFTGKYEVKKENSKNI